MLSLLRNYQYDNIIFLGDFILITPAKPANEEKRLAALKSYGLLGTLPEKDFDSITNLAASICEVPISLVTLMDADVNFLKSHHGIPFNESPRETSFCGHAIIDDNPVFIIEDARKDLRFANNPVVKEQGVVFYAGVTLINPDGYALGTLCVFDTKPRALSEHQKEALSALAYQVSNLIEIRKKNKTLNKLQKKLKKKNKELKSFAGIVSHDMKMPLANMIVTADILKAKYDDKLDAKGKEYLQYLKHSSFTLSDYISGLLAHYESENVSMKSKETFDLHTLLEDIVDLLNISIDCEINFPEDHIEVTCNRTALEQILLNLIGNSIKYNDKAKIVIDISFSQNELFYKFKVKDNGIGIPKDKKKDVFKLFSTADTLDRDGNKGNGIGLSTVKNLVTKQGGKISVASRIKEGTTFTFTIPAP